jgi:hypothetical protein
MYNMAGHVLVISVDRLFLEERSPMKRFYFVLLMVSLGSVALAQNKNAPNPALRPYHAKPVMKAAPAHRAPGAAIHHNGGGNPGLAPAKTGTDAQLSALEHQQATVHNPKPAPRTPAPAMVNKANNPAGGNKPMNFAYKAPNANNAPVGGMANGRKQH